jgi:hypothetical protein
MAQISIAKVATNSHHSDPTKGMDSRNPQRSRSQVTIRVRRSNLSATAPASGANSIAGSNLVATTPPRAKLCAW